ncbi:cytochrome b5 domain-containing protein [Clostridium sp.]
MSINMDQYIYELYKEAEYFKYKMMRANTFDHEIFYKNSLNDKLSKLSNFLEDDFRVSNNLSSHPIKVRQQEFTPAELAKYNGANGSPSYVAINGIVYDVSNVLAWTGGYHFGLSAGANLTENFSTCHGSSNIIDNLPKVGVLKVQ